MVDYGDMVDRTLSVGTFYQFERDHALRVSRLALRLFDQLQPMHGMGNTERIWLRTAALLHDVGKRVNRRYHHKVSRDIIVEASELPFRRPERILIGLAARYHRGALPNKQHAYFRDLESDARRYVAKLAALLRLADGLDKGRAGLVEDLWCEGEGQSVQLTLLGRGAPATPKILRKADLFEKVFRRRLAIASEIAGGRVGLSLDSTAEIPYSRTV